jgi:signal transduction histidine kinase
MRLDQDPGIGTHTGRELRDILDEIGFTVNTLTFELSPPVLRHLGFRAAVRWLAGNMRERYGLSVEIDADERQMLLDESVGMVLFRSVRELLINVIKHARTNSARVSIRKFGGNLKVRVADRGIGFDPAGQLHRLEGGRFGLFSIRERLEYLDGTIQIKSAPGQGTTVTLIAPLAAEKTAGAAK